MITQAVDIKKHRRIGWCLWTAQAVALFVAFVIGYAPALLVCLFFGLWIGLHGDPINDEY